MRLILGTANFNKNYFGTMIQKTLCFDILKRAKELGVIGVATAFDYGVGVVDEYGSEGFIVFHKQNMDGELWVDGDKGKSVYHPFFAKEILDDGWLMAPFNPWNLDFLPYCSHERFIARSIFGRGKYRNCDKRAIADITFAFLRSHNVKNVVIGVDSLEDLEINVEASRTHHVG